jgi:hypothetical protein
VAEPILRLSPQLTAADLDAIARERGPDYAAIIATRTLSQLAPSSAARPTSTPAPGMAPASAPPPRQPAAKSPNKIDSSTAIAPQASKPGTMPAIEAKELCGLFFAASPIERRYILISLEFVATPPPALPTAMQQTDIWRFESAALQHKTEAVVRELERALGISRKTALRIIEDDMGEPIVAAAKAMELPTDVLQRILLFMNPRVGQSVDRVYELANLYADISADAAHRLIGIWRDADPPDARTPKHLALWQDAVEQARTALSDITRRAPVPRRDAPAIRPGERAVGTDRR